MTTGADRKKGLGMGLDALLGNREIVGAVTGRADAVVKKDTGHKHVSVTALKRGKGQPRQEFDQSALEELAESIKAHGILQPILVRPNRDAHAETVPYEIVAGERRWRAAQLAKIHEVPVIIRDFDDRQIAEIGLIENLQRQDLNPIEEARAYQRLMDEFGHTQEDMAKSLGKSRSHIANTLRLLKLPENVRRNVEVGLLSAGHGRALIGHDKAEALALKVIQKDLSVRATEALAQGRTLAKKPKLEKYNPKAKSADIVALENEIAHVLGMKVSVDHGAAHGGKGGKIAIEYGTLDQLDDLLDRLTLGRYKQSR